MARSGNFIVSTVCSALTSVVLLAVHALSFGLTSWVRAQRGMDGPDGGSGVAAIGAAWLRYLGRAASGDLGMIPYVQSRPVAQVAAEALPAPITTSRPVAG